MKRLIAAVAMAIGALIVFSTSVLAGTLVVVSGPSPYGACSTNAGTTPGTNFPNAEVEPQVSVNPRNTDNIITSFQQDRWSNGGAHGIQVGFSSNGGQDLVANRPPLRG